jgi:hypothetical protein
MREKMGQKSKKSQSFNAKLEEVSCVLMPEWWWAEAAPEVLEGWK